MDSFISGQYENMKLANYEFACFANYTLNNATNGFDWDGTVNRNTSGEFVEVVDARVWSPPPTDTFL